MSGPDITMDKADFRRVDVAGIPITDCRLDDLRGLIAGAITTRTQLQLATVNLDFLRLSARRPELRAVLQHRSLCVADGWPVLALARRGGLTSRERVTGSDLLPRLCDWAAASGWRLGVVGGGERTVARVADVVTGTHGASLAGHWLPNYRTSDAKLLRDPHLTDRIRSTKTDILLVALGCPKQELWLAENLSASGAVVGIGIGASLDFLVGAVARAPGWIQTIRLEFLFRALLEPRRLLSRYSNDFWFLLHMLARQRHQDKR